MCPFILNIPVFSPSCSFTEPEWSTVAVTGAGRAGPADSAVSVARYRSMQIPIRSPHIGHDAVSS